MCFALKVSQKLSLPPGTYNMAASRLDSHQVREQIPQNNAETMNNDHEEMKTDSR